jgi:hypothetical protein
MTQEFNMKEISYMDFAQHGEIFYFYGQALKIFPIKYYCQIFPIKFLLYGEVICVQPDVLLTVSSNFVVL